MESEEKIEERKKWNAPFLRAFSYLIEEGIAATKGELCARIGIDPGLISRYTKGIKKVSVETMNELVRVSKGEVNLNYLLGKSDFMLLANVPDDEVSNYRNPDREAIEKRKEKEKSEPIQPDFSSYINALLAKTDETISSLKRELAAKDEIIQEKNARIADLTKLAEERLHRIAELRRVIDANNFSTSNYPFPIGTAEQPTKRI